MYSIGIDSGSVATKGVIYDGEMMVDHLIIPTGWSPKKASNQILNRLLERADTTENQVKVIATGYGRKSIPTADKVITEITCHAKGAHFLDKDVRTIVDIGGQDSKVISIDENGSVIDFLMNEKCAAGTGRFLEVMVNLLEEDLDDLDKLTDGAKPETINSMCTVFAESEVISLLAKGASKESVAAGIIHSIAARTISLLGKISVRDKVLFTGGLANSDVLREVLSNKLKREIDTSEYSQIAGALGAAVIGWDKLIK